MGKGRRRGDVEELRELAAWRESVFAQVREEVEAMKGELRRRADAIAEREQELGDLERRLDANGLAEELAAAKRAAAEAEAERRLAAAERERLDEREQQIRAVEKELAARRRELDERDATLRGDTMSLPAGFADGLPALAHPEAS